MAWTDAARDELLSQRSGGPGWGYRPGAEAFVEPTALAGLALVVSAPEAVVGRAVRDAADWLAEIQTSGGALGLCARIPAPGWATPWALLFWAALGGYQPERDKAAGWLLRLAGKTWPPDPQSPTAHDTSIPGWPWVEGTHSWVEPTAAALLALRREGRGGHVRARQGVRMICDRAVPGGAWNFGNRATFGRPYPPQLAATGLALLALGGEGGAGELAEKGCRYLRRALPPVRAPQSLAWGVMGLDAWQRRPPEADGWLAESFARIRPNRPTPVDLALLILAAHRQTLDLLGVGLVERSTA